MSEGKALKPGPKRKLSDSERKRNKKASNAKTRKHRIYIGVEYDRWMEIKNALRLERNSEVTKILLDSYYGEYGLSKCSATKKTKENSGPETEMVGESKTTPCARKKKTSSPAPPFCTSRLHLNVADVSEISSSEHETNVVPSLLTKDQRTERLNENKSFEPQLDSVNSVKDVLRSTIDRLKDLGGEVAAWVAIPNEDNSSLIHHMGSQKGREFIRCKPDIDAELHVFLQNYKIKGCGKKISSQATSKKKLDEESCCVENVETASCDGEPHEAKPTSHSILDDGKPTNVVFSVKGLDDDSSCLVVRQEDDSSEEEPRVNTPCMTSSRQNSTERKKFKRKISSVYMDQLSDDERLSESSEETRDSLQERCEELFADKYVLAILKGKMGFPYQLLKRCGKPWFTLSGFPEDLLPFRHPSEYDIDSLKRIVANRDKLVFNLPNRTLNETCGMESGNKKIMTDVQKRFHQTSTLLSNTSFVPAKEIDLLKSFAKQVQEPHSSQKDVPSTNIFKPLLQPTGDKNVAENTLLLDKHLSTIDKCNLETSGDVSFTHITEETMDYEFIKFQDPSRENIVTDNTAQLDTDTSTAEKSNMVFRGNNFILNQMNQIMIVAQNRFPQTSTLLPNSSFVPAKEIDLSKSFAFQRQVQEPHSNQKDVPPTHVFIPFLQPIGDKNVAENTLLLDKHLSTTDKSNLETSRDDSFTRVKEETVDHEFIKFQEPTSKNSVTDNTAQLDTDTSTAEKSNMVFMGDNFIINQIKEEPVDYELLYVQEGKQ